MSFCFDTLSQRAKKRVRQRQSSLHGKMVPIVEEKRTISRAATKLAIAELIDQRQDRDVRNLCDSGEDRTVGRKLAFVLPAGNADV